MHDLVSGFAQHWPALLGGGTLTALYVAIWRHAPEKFPRTVDDWWAWFRGANQEIAAQRGGAANPTQGNPK